MRGHVATAMGLTPDRIDALPFPDVTDLFKHWKKYPPAHVLLRWYTKYEPKEDYGADVALPPALMAQAQRNVKPLSAMPSSVSEMIAAIQKGEVPGLKHV